MLENNLLSQVSKTEIIRSITNSIPSHFIGVFKPPNIFYKSINNIQKDFFWNNHNTSKKISQISQKKITRPKSMGGLGIKYVELMNKTYLLKSRCLYLTNANSV